MTAPNDNIASSHPIGQPATEVKRRGKKPSGIVKNNVCVRLTDETKGYLLGVGKGSTSRGVDTLIEWHRQANSSQQAQPPAVAP